MLLDQPRLDNEIHPTISKYLFMSQAASRVSKSGTDAILEDMCLKGFGVLTFHCPT
jgi:hypothetical protein